MSAEKIDALFDWDWAMSCWDCRHYDREHRYCSVQDTLIPSVIAVRPRLPVTDEGPCRSWECRRDGKKMKGDSSPVDFLSDWEWTTLVGAWRYYEYRNTIASATFPSQIVERYWRGRGFTDCVRTRIAYQFAKVDHGANAETDWKSQPECDRVQWAKFHAFCAAWCDGFHEVECTPRFGCLVVVSFKCETTGRLYPVAEYIRNPLVECYLDAASVVKVEKMNDISRPRREAMKGTGK